MIGASEFASFGSAMITASSERGLGASLVVVEVRLAGSTCLNEQDDP